MSDSPSEQFAGFVALHGAVVTAWFIFGVLRRRGSTELRIRILESLAAAARHGVPLGPVVERASLERRGRVRAALIRLSEDLESGTSIADALVACAPLCVSGATAASIRGAEGSAAIVDALSAAARESSSARVARGRVWAQAAYPLLVIAILIPMTLATVRTFDRLGDCVESMEIERAGGVGPAWLRASWVPDVPVWLVATVLAAITVAWIVRRARAALGGGGRSVVPTWNPLGELPPFRGPSRLAGASAFLGALAAQVGGGRPLPEAARLAAEASRNLAVRRGAQRLAGVAESGGGLMEAWDEIPLPASIRPRAAAACRRAPRDAAAALERLAVECRARLDLAIEARVRWIAPAGLAVAAFGVGSIAFALFNVQGLVLRSQIHTW